MISFLTRFITSLYGALVAMAAVVLIFGSAPQASWAANISPPRFETRAPASVERPADSTTLRSETPKQTRIRGTAEDMEDSMQLKGGDPAAKKNVDEMLRQASGLITGDSGNKMTKRALK
jgi:hypothetical protein